MPCEVYAHPRSPNARLGIFVGFASFFIMEKTLRVLGDDDEGSAGHSHSHSHSHTNGTAEHAVGHSTGVSSSASANGLKARANGQGDKSETDDKDEIQDAPKQTSKLSAYLNLFGDFVHNMYVSRASPERPKLR